MAINIGITEIWTTKADSLKSTPNNNFFENSTILFDRVSLYLEMSITGENDFSMNIEPKGE